MLSRCIEGNQLGRWYPLNSTAIAISLGSNLHLKALFEEHPKCLYLATSKYQGGGVDSIVSHRGVKHFFPWLVKHQTDPHKGYQNIVHIGPRLQPSDRADVGAQPRP